MSLVGRREFVGQAFLRLRYCMRGFSHASSDYIKSLTLKQSKDKIRRPWVAPAYVLSPISFRRLLGGHVSALVYPHVATFSRCKSRAESIGKYVIDHYTCLCFKTSEITIVDVQVI
jgi:hypothetical protein